MRKKHNEILNECQKRKERSPEAAYLFMYTSLAEELRVGHHEACDEFIIKIMNENMKDTDMLCHALNILSTKKSKLRNWNEFIEYSSKVFIDIHGKEYTSLLMRVIMEER